MQKLAAEIIFLEPADRDAAIPALLELGFTIERLDDWKDPASDACWINAIILSEREPDEFFDWVMELVEPLGGDVVKAAGYQPRYKPAPY